MAELYIGDRVWLGGRTFQARGLSPLGADRHVVDFAVVARRSFRENRRGVASLPEELQCSGPSGDRGRCCPAAR